MDFHSGTGVATFTSFMAATLYLERDSKWAWWQAAVFAGVIMIGMEILARAIPILFGGLSQIPNKGKHLDQFDTRDRLFIFLNRFTAVPFVYHVLSAAINSPTVKIGLEEMTLMNTFGSFIVLYVVYDFFYTLFHRFLHLRSVYWLVHKHHHRQHAPSRGNSDAVNVHPFEYICGEYNHLLAIMLVPCHIVAALAFIVVGGVLASLNHTRFEAVIPWGIYDVKVHDLHHRVPQSNYGQYIMLWDRIMGSYRAYT
mmetsp:Transcript_35704/g.77932  ORF Transcript_35704/g.77932 Transcript_35704/m.77932 type:complete len:254 (+) Transcript_35704:304-1065(+)|eukprot:CAMPEP_0118927812 /NCGR_PEP_ID=MMETSP1169-20130426/5211_1 /TAXON_ID=36882 /ORGANISM="Pyramimonas obovata, Strain CCMP722" /LENGTH=253 /DNA_ID=CAMNT_0006869659 /DNA_START=304 /DNA_END=1065 /DNA_ORIENTATION=-